MSDCYALVISICVARYTVHDDRGTYVRGTVRMCAVQCRVPVHESSAVHVPPNRQSNALRHILAFSAETILLI